RLHRRRRRRPHRRLCRRRTAPARRVRPAHPPGGVRGPTRRPGRLPAQTIRHPGPPAGADPPRRPGHHPRRRRRHLATRRVAAPGERMTEAFDAVAARLTAALGERVERDVPFSRLTTYGLGGPAAVLVRANDEADLAAVARVLPP